ncbi:MAG: PQQ-binding-like beta-propeller repeat protein, partial [Myxococcota bacterium]
MTLRSIFAIIAIGFVIGCSDDTDSDASTDDTGTGSDIEANDAETEPGDTSTGADVDAEPDWSCNVVQPSPYPNSPYVGSHANASNNDFIPCTTADAFEQAWEALPLRAIIQPNTFSPDGATTYVTTSNPEPDGCTVYALNIASGDEDWCRFFPGAVSSSVEVDEDGALYVAADGVLASLDDTGEDRWLLPLKRADDSDDNAIGLHFDPATGHIVTITQAGRVLAVERSDGTVVAELSLPEETGFEPPAGVTAGLDLDALAPPEVSADFDRLFGEGVGTSFLGAFFGASGDFSDNTISVGQSGDLYIVGGGPDPERGSLIQVLYDGQELSIGWILITRGGSAASPSVSPDGTMLTVGDGVVGLTDPNPPVPRLLIVDLQ